MTTDNAWVIPLQGEFIATCHTEGCGNENDPFSVTADLDNPFIVCGPCNQQITDIIPVSILPA